MHLRQASPRSPIPRATRTPGREASTSAHATAATNILTPSASSRAPGAAWSGPAGSNVRSTTQPSIAPLARSPFASSTRRPR